MLPHMTYQVRPPHHRQAHVNECRQVYFAAHTKTAIVELNASVRRTLRAVLRTMQSPPPAAFLTSHMDFLGAWRSVTDIPPPPFFSREEEDYFIEQYQIQGFEYSTWPTFFLRASVDPTPAAALQFYTVPNRRASYDFVRAQGNHTIPQPALFIAPTGVSPQPALSTSAD